MFTAGSPYFYRIQLIEGTDQRQQRGLRQALIFAGGIRQHKQRILGARLDGARNHFGAGTLVRPHIVEIVQLADWCVHETQAVRLEDGHLLVEGRIILASGGERMGHLRGEQRIVHIDQANGIEAFQRERVGQIGDRQQLAHRWVLAVAGWWRSCCHHDGRWRNEYDYE